MRILAHSKDTPEASWTGAEALLRVEAAEVWRLTKSGLLQNIWFTHPGRDAVILLAARLLLELSCFPWDPVRTATSMIPEPSGLYHWPAART